jgi:heme-degrading monooxygenase HmoA
MVIEHAVLNVRAERCIEFENAMKSAMPLIAQTPGFLGFELRPCLEHQGQYLLRVQWRALEDHTIGFRQSDRYEAWRRMLHGFYEPFPAVEHYGEPVIATG